MGQFFKSLLASCLGMMIAMALLFFIGIGVIGQLASQAEKPKVVQPTPYFG